MEEVQELVKGGERWLQLSIDRTSKGLDIWVKVDERVEEFIAGLGDDSFDKLESYGKGWKSGDPLNPIQVSHLSTEFEERGSYSIQQPGTSLYYPGYNPNGKIEKAATNLSFLRFQGVGSPSGVKFFVVGPATKDYVKKVSERILISSRELIKDYISPVHINLTISSQEL